MKLAICVITYQRPLGLKRLLEGLHHLTFARTHMPDLEVVVVDNDPTGSAREICHDMARTLRWPLRYFVEPERGIPQARNRAIVEVSGGVEFIVFIDDDEIPSPAWIEELTAVQARYDADVVAGPVLPRFESVAPRWVRKGRFFDQPRHPTGAAIKFAGTCNLLLRSSVLRQFSPVFDPRFALTGGSDTHLNMRLQRIGAKMVWADAAEVYEVYPDSRVRVRWLVLRAFRLGISMSACEHAVEAALSVRITRITKSVARIALGLAMLPSAVVFGRVTWVRALQNISRGLGMVAGAVGARYNEYRTIHGA